MASSKCKVSLGSFRKDKCGMTPSQEDGCLYERNYKNGLETLVMIYFDDILIISKDNAILNITKIQFSSRFKRKLIGVVRWFPELRPIIAQVVYS